MQWGNMHRPMRLKHHWVFYILEGWYRIDSGGSARLGCLELEGGVFACPIPHSDRFPWSSGPASSAAEGPRGCRLHCAQYRPHSPWHRLSTEGGGGCHSSPRLALLGSHLRVGYHAGGWAPPMWAFGQRRVRIFHMLFKRNIFTGMGIWVTWGFIQGPQRGKWFQWANSPHSC